MGTGSYHHNKTGSHLDQSEIEEVLWQFRRGREGCGDEDDFILKVIWKLDLYLWTVRGKAQETYRQDLTEAGGKTRRAASEKKAEKVGWSEILESLKHQAKEAVAFH